MLIYNLVIWLYSIVIKIAAIKNNKAKQWVAGRKYWKDHLQLNVKKLNLEYCIWVHCASYGEFEQGRPLIESIKQKFTNSKIVLSFFSPSGYEAFKNYSNADYICYLPIDSKSNAEYFINILKPQTVIFIKYEFWLNFLNVLKEKKIKTYLVSAVFKKHHPFFKWYGDIFRKSLYCFDKLFLQDKLSGKLLTKINIKHFEIAGDTRFDRVLQIKKTNYSNQLVQQFSVGVKVIVAGSTYARDDEFLIKSFKNTLLKTYKLIIAPHEVSEKRIKELKELLLLNSIPFQLFSDSVQNNNAQVLIINCIGTLSKLYRFANIAYIGGGFGEGLHNTLEPSVYSIPVIFYGKDYKRFNEIVQLVEMQCAFSVESNIELEKKILELTSTESSAIEKKLENYFIENSGVTEKILQVLEN
ncbi:MAG: 3-deoxy-D-manno-octulosonic acid transferase [Bacteroidetes bacterium]|nr:3-deoxy-D-manno-octulosonic acid transferase [Bacteroidota bacterium]